MTFRSPKTFYQVGSALKKLFGLLNTSGAATGQVLTWNDTTKTTYWSTVSGGGGPEINDLTAIVTWANVPDANITQSSVTQHQAALSITESQVSDLGSYLTNISGESIKDLSDVYSPMTPLDGQVLTYDTANGWQAETPSSGVTDHTLLSNIGTNTHAQIDSHISDSTTHFTQASINITESQISDFDSYLPTSGGSLTGWITFPNAAGVQIKDTGGSAVAAFRIDTANYTVIRSGGAGVEFEDNSGTVIGILKDNGSHELTGDLDLDGNIKADNLCINAANYASIQTAIDTAEALITDDWQQRGYTIYIPQGDYLLTTGLTIQKSGVSLVSDPGRGARLYATTGITLLTIGNGTTLQFENHVHNILFDNTTNATNSIGVHVQTASQGSIQGCTFYNLETGLKGTRMNRFVVQNCNWFLDATTSYADACVHLLGSSAGSGGGNHFTDCELAGKDHTSATIDSCFLIEETDGLYIQNCHTRDCDHAITINPNGTTGKNKIDSVFVENTYFDENWDVCVDIKGSIASGGRLQRIWFTNCFFRGTDGHPGQTGLRSQITSNAGQQMTDLQIIGGSIVDWADRGVFIRGDNNGGYISWESVRISNVTFEGNNSSDTSNSGCDINIDARSVSITGCIFAADAGAASTSCIYARKGSNGVLINSNNFYQATAANYVAYDGGTGTTVEADNLPDSGGAGASGFVYALWKAKGNLASASFDDVENVIPWNNWAIDGGSDVTLSGTPQSDITINTTGTYKFTVTLRTDNANRTELFIRTYIDTGGGYVQDTSEIVSDYVSRDNDQDTGSVTLSTALALTATDKIEFRGFGDTDGASTGLDAGTILIVERVS